MNTDITDKAMNGIESATENFKNMLKDKNKWLLMYLILIIVFIVWLIFWYIRNKLGLLNTNNLNMISNFDSISGSKISNINSANASHKHLLRDYYMASSYNSCW